MSNGIIRIRLGYDLGTFLVPVDFRIQQKTLVPPVHEDFLEVCFS